MINDEFLAEQADHFAKRVERCLGTRLAETDGRPGVSDRAGP